MAKAWEIELGDGTCIPVLYEDRSVMAIDKPAGWMLAPDAWDETGRNLQLALASAVREGVFWARSRNLKYLRFVHRLDAEASGVLLLAKSPGALQAYSELFELRRVEKIYLAVVQGVPSAPEWVCHDKLAPDPRRKGRMKIDASGQSKEAETRFHLLQAARKYALVEARPLTGRTHQIRVHLAAAGHPVAGDTLYGPDQKGSRRPKLALRAVSLAYRDPFQQQRVRIEAPFFEFARRHGFDLDPSGLANR